MTTTSTTPFAEFGQKIARYYQEHYKCILDDRGIPMIHRDTGGAAVGILAVQTMRFIYPWVDAPMRADIRGILWRLGYVVPAEVTPGACGYDVTTSPGFTRFADVHDWFASMSDAFRKLGDEGLLDQLDPVVDDEDADQRTDGEEADHCTECCEREYYRDVECNATPVLDGLRAMSHDLQAAIAFLETRRRLARERLAGARQI